MLEAVTLTGKLNHLLRQDRHGTNSLRVRRKFIILQLVACQADWQQYSSACKNVIDCRTLLLQLSGFSTRGHICCTCPPLLTRHTFHPLTVSVPQLSRTVVSVFRSLTSFMDISTYSFAEEQIVTGTHSCLLVTSRELQSYHSFVAIL